MPTRPACFRHRLANIGARIVPHVLACLAVPALADNVLRETPTGLTNGARPGQLIGGGSVGVLSSRIDEYRERIDLYAQLNLGVVRISMNPGGFLRAGIPNPNKTTTRELVDYAIERGLQPYLLFDNRPTYHGGTFSDLSVSAWYEIGRSFAQTYSDRVQVYNFINEVDNFDSVIETQEFIDRLQAFSNGVHSVSPALKVSTGGFASASDPTKTQQFLEAIAPLANAGDLYALNIHTYHSLFDDELRIANGTNNAGPNAIFERQKQAAGITANLRYSASEWNLRYGGGDAAQDDLAAGEFLTAMWDQLGVVGNGGNNDHVVEFTGAYSLTGDPDRAFVLQDNPVGTPWVGNERGQVFEMVMDLTHDAAFKEVRPQGDGYYILESDDAKIWVLQNRTGWRDLGSTANTTVADIPEWADVMELWYHDGLAETQPITGVVQAFDVRPEETVMFVARAIDITLSGDFDGDGQVDQSDLNLVLNNWGSNSTPDNWINQRPSVGEIVAQTQLNHVLTHWGDRRSPGNELSAIPEPAAGLFALAILFATTRLSNLRSIHYPQP